MTTIEEKKEKYDAAIDTVFRHLLSQIEAGAGSFEMPWHRGLPQAVNAKTGKFYSGNNQWLLWHTCGKGQFTFNQWATLKQWRQLGASVRKGEKGTLICIFIPVKASRERLAAAQMKLFEPITAEDQRHYADYFKLKFQYLFNTAQVDGYFGNQPGLFDPLGDAEARIAELVRRSGAMVHTEGERAFYHSVEDYIQLPELLRFKHEADYTSSEKYQSVLLHELIHWTGHSKRCNRSLMNRFGSPAYAFEELVAEIGSAILSSHFRSRVYPRIDHAQYVAGWLRVLKNDPSFCTEALELARTGIYWLFEKTGVYPHELKPQFVRQAQESRIRDWTYYLR